MLSFIVPTLRMIQSMDNTGSIFIIADHHSWAVRSVKWRLEQLLGDNINVSTGNNGEDAIQLFNKVVSDGNHSRLKAVILGCHMPNYSGQQAAAEIRNIERMNRFSLSVAIVGTTTDLNDSVHAEFIQAGANFVLEKPVPEGVLEQIVTAIIVAANN